MNKGINRGKKITIIYSNGVERSTNVTYLGIEMIGKHSFIKYQTEDGDILYSAIQFIDTILEVK